MNIELLQRRAIHLALRGKSFHKTNPMVGCVIYDVHNHILSEGWHTAYGRNHAEREAIYRFLDKYPNKSLRGQKMCVSLEPCNIHGKTPPCTEIIIEQNLNDVSICDIDPNPKMKGKSLDILSGHDITSHHIPHEDSEQLIRSFTINQSHKRPYVILKFAQSSDGFLSKFNEQVKISNPVVDHLVHKWRSEVDGILIGRNTLEIDNPALTTRLYYGPSPLRYVITHKAVDDLRRYHLFSTAHYKQLYYKGAKSTVGHKIENIDDLKAVLHTIFTDNIGTLMIEGGANVLYQFVKTNLWDEARIITSTSLRLMSGIKAPMLNVDVCESIDILDNRIELYYNK